MQKHLKGSRRAAASIKLLENLPVWEALRANLCPGGEASPSIPFGGQLSGFCHCFSEQLPCAGAVRATACPEGVDCLPRKRWGRMEKGKSLQSTGRGGGGSERWNEGVLGCVRNVLPVQ